MIVNLKLAIFVFNHSSISSHKNSFDDNITVKRTQKPKPMICKNSVWIFLFLINSLSIFSQSREVAFLTTSAEYSATAANSSSDLPGDLVYVPFDLTDGKIFVNARLEGEQKSFMLDTGAPGLVLNTSQTPENIEKNADGVTGGLYLQTVTVKTFEWAGMRTDDTDAVAVNISHLEKAAGRNLAGLIGYDVLKNTEVLFDYEKNLLLLSANRRSAWHRDRTPKAVFDFEMYDHLPVLKVKIGGETVRLGLDCGAEINLLDASFLKKLPRPLLSNKKKEILTGVNQAEILSVASTVSLTEIGKEKFADMRYLFTDLSDLKNEDGKKLDGLLGFPFFESAVISINYKKQKLYVW